MIRPFLYASRKGRFIFEEGCIMGYFSYEVKGHILSRENFKPFPSITSRDVWESIDKGEKDNLISQAESHLGYTDLYIPATTLLAFSRSGDRGIFDRAQSDRLYALSLLVQAECVENRGRFLDDIINIIWVLCEQTTWVATAHYYLMAEGAKRAEDEDAPTLPDQNQQVVDLVSGEIGAALAITHTLLKDSLDKVSPEICKRIEEELLRRVINPYLEREDFWWMGYQSDFVNNWSPWCTSNCLIATLLIESNTGRRERAVEKSFDIIGKFMSTYGSDGGCDEGSTYWFRAGGSLFDCLEVLFWASDGYINEYHKPLVKNIGEFIAKMHIGSDQFVNFADGQSRVEEDWPLLYRYGERTQSDAMMNLASELWAKKPDILRIERSLLRTVPFLLRSTELHQLLSKKLHVTQNSEEYLLSDIQVAVLKHSTPEGSLFLAAKGGHNNESHNHNDVGQYIMYVDSTPLIIDVGCEAYTKETFGPNRYSIWTMQSRFHNVPEVNGVMQAHGSEYRATDFSCSLGSEISSVSLDIAKAYPDDAGVISWNRTLRMDKSDTHKITLTEQFNLSLETANIQCPFMVKSKPVVESDKGRVILSSSYGIDYNVKDLSVKVETITLSDSRLINAWGDTLYRVVFSPIAPQSQGCWEFAIHKIS